MPRHYGALALARHTTTHPGHSVCAFVHGFEPYFLVQAPDRRFSPDDCEALRGALNVRLGVCKALPQQTCTQYGVEEWCPLLRQ